MSSNSRQKPHGGQAWVRHSSRSPNHGHAVWKRRERLGLSCWRPARHGPTRSRQVVPIRLGIRLDGEDRASFLFDSMHSWVSGTARGQDRSDHAEDNALLVVFNVRGFSP